LINIWESAVKATHHFLKEEDFEFYKHLMPTFLSSVELTGIKNEEQEIVGFIGTSNENLEMLFIHENMRGKGVGKILLKYAIEKLNISKVDVNQDNLQAVGFYEHFGFKTITLSATDALGKPYPILHMTL
jgi:putative acetyltransferase